MLSNTDLLKGRIRNFKRLSERRAEFTLGIAQDTPAAKVALIPAIIRDAIDAHPKARFDRAHFKKYGEAALVFEAAFYFGDPDYNRYMDVQQAINLTILRRLQKEGIALAGPTPAPVAVTEGAPERGEAGTPRRTLARDTSR